MEPSPFQSGIYRTADRQLNGGLERFLRERRAEGASLREMQADLNNLGVSVSLQGILNWCERLGIEKGRARTRRAS